MVAIGTRIAPPWTPIFDAVPPYADLIDGKAIAADIRKETAEVVKRIKDKTGKVGLGAGWGIMAHANIAEWHRGAARLEGARGVRVLTGTRTQGGESPRHARVSGEVQPAAAAAFCWRI